MPCLPLGGWEQPLGRCNNCHHNCRVWWRRLSLESKHGRAWTLFCCFSEKQFPWFPCDYHYWDSWGRQWLAGSKSDLSFLMPLERLSHTGYFIMHYLLELDNAALFLDLHFEYRKGSVTLLLKMPVCMKCCLYRVSVKCRCFYTTCMWILYMFVQSTFIIHTCHVL